MYIGPHPNYMSNHLSTTLFPVSPIALTNTAAPTLRIDIDLLSALGHPNACVDRGLVAGDRTLQEPPRMFGSANIRGNVFSSFKLFASLYPNLPPSIYN